MSNLDVIEQRHRPDLRRDVVFIVTAALLALLAVGSVTSRAAGHVTLRPWTLTVVESNLELNR
jgi:hypothetical protein